ncbi:MAG: DUF615 domain-containing protein [Desulfovibrionaceae bacterium]|nr:DUF615 domain-containing protein [Desulfovibrionaceae bacterium]
MRKKFLPVSDHDFEQPSRSELKRQSAARQRLGEELTRLSPSLWQNFSISPQLMEALEDYEHIKGFEGKRRQLQFIGRLMRDEDCAQIALELEQLRAGRDVHTAAFHELERVREQILQNNPDIWQELEQKLSDIYPELGEAERENLLIPVRRLAEAAARRQDKASSRALFRVLRSLLKIDSADSE